MRERAGSAPIRIPGTVGAVERGESLPTERRNVRSSRPTPTRPVAGGGLCASRRVHPQSSVPELPPQLQDPGDLADLGALLRRHEGDAGAGLARAPPSPRGAGGPSRRPADRLITCVMCSRSSPRAAAEPEHVVFAPMQHWASNLPSVRGAGSGRPPGVTCGVSHAGLDGSNMTGHVDRRTGGSAGRGGTGSCQSSEGDREEDRLARAEGRRRHWGTGRTAPRRGVCTPGRRAPESQGRLVSSPTSNRQASASGRPGAWESRGADAVAELLVSDRNARVPHPERSVMEPHHTTECGRPGCPALRPPVPGPRPGGPTRGHRMRSPARCGSDLQRRWRRTCRRSSRYRAHRGATPRPRPVLAPGSVHPVPRGSRPRDRRDQHRPLAAAHKTAPMS